MTTWLEDLTKDNPTQDCYSPSEIRAHFTIKDLVMSQVYEVTFDSFSYVIPNYDFAFHLKADEKNFMYLYVRCGQLEGEKDYPNPEHAVEAALASYRLFVSLPRSSNGGPEPEILLADSNGMSIDLDEEEKSLERKIENHRQIANPVLLLKGQFIRVKIIHCASGSFNALVVHVSSILQLVADETFLDFDQAKAFGDVYLTKFDTSAPPELPHALAEYAKVLILN